MLFYKKIEFNLIYLSVRDLDLIMFRKEILKMYNDNTNYGLKPNSIYYVHLIDLSSNNGNINVLINTPFYLLSRKDNEECIEELFFKLLPYLQSFLKSCNDNYPTWFGLFIAPINTNYINTKYFASYKQECLKHNAKTTKYKQCI